MNPKSVIKMKARTRAGGGLRGGVYSFAHVLHGCSLMAIDPRISPQRRDGPRRVFTDQVDIAWTKRKAKREVCGESQARRMGCTLVL